MREAAERRQQLELEHEQALAVLNAKQQEIDLLQKVRGPPLLALQVQAVRVKDHRVAQQCWTSCSPTWVESTEIIQQEFCRVYYVLLLHSPSHFLGAPFFF